MENENKILEKLDQIILHLQNEKQIMSFEQFCGYASISKSTGYKLTHRNQLPFYRPQGKLIYFEKSEVDKWLLKNRVRSEVEIREEVYNGNLHS